MLKYREPVLDVLERICGNRVIHSISRVGGVSKDLTKEQIDMILKMLDTVEISG
jgi:ech hydrogenase subunit E